MDIVVERKVLELVGWPTDTFSVDYSVLPPGRHEQDSAAGTTPLVDKSNDSNVHTVILFIPGNPGLNEWYIPFFSSILQALDSGYVVRGASYAGHSIDPRQIRVEETYYDDLPSDNQDTSDATTTAASQSTIVPPKTIAWTIDGQVHHKLDYMDKIAQEFQSLSSNPQRPLRWILVGHSIGCHLMQRMLVLRPDLAACTTTCLYLMPFIRMDAPSPHQQFLDWAAASPERSACILQTKARFLAQFSGKFLEKMLESIMDRPQDRVFTAQLIRQTRFPLNFLGIGVEEIRDLPQAIDVPALRYICARQGIPITILFAGNDHWSPEFHIDDLQQLQDRGVLPPREQICLRYMAQLKHDFVTSESQTSTVANVCIDWIRGCARREVQQTLPGNALRAKL